MKITNRRRAANSAGFIISLEFLLVMTLVVFPLLLGFFLLAQKMVTLYLNYQAAVEQPLSRPVVWDSSVNASLNAKPVGPVIGYDQFGAPQILYRDNTTPFNAGNFKPGVLMGVRPFRFTTRSRVYYTGTVCDGTPYIKTAFVTPPSSMSTELDIVSQLQGINYAVGNGNVLYREAVVPVSAPVATIGVRSYWNSQETGDGSVAATPAVASCFTYPFPTASDSISAINGNGTTVTGATSITLQIGDIVSISGVQCQEPNPAYPACGGVPFSCPVNIAAPCGGTFNVSPVTLTAGGIGTFMYPADGQIVAPVFYVANSGTITVLSTRLDLVATTLVGDLDNGNAAGTTGNFFPAFRLAFPTAVAGPPLPVKVCPGSEGCP